MKKRLLVLLVILSAALFLRTYRTADFLGFWYDQGRDALVIWKLWHEGKFFLIGPTTGIEGIFLGPFYYYLISPFYLFGGGNPVFPAFFLAFLTTLAIFYLYKIGTDFFLPVTGILAAFLYAFSKEIIYYNRWLSNPTALPLFALVAFWLLLQIIYRRFRSWHWLLLGLMMGLSLQLEAASAVFFVPAVALILLVNFRRELFRQKSLLLHLAFGFFLTLLPQLIFNFKHQNILFLAFRRFLVTENSFQTTVSNFYQTRLDFYLSAVANKFFPVNNLKYVFLFTTLVLLVMAWKFLPKKLITAGLIWVSTPFVLLLFYHGNKGYVWDYYFTGIYPVIFLLIAAIWTISFKHLRLARGIVVLLIGAFIYQNGISNYKFLTQRLPDHITLTHIVNAVDWVYKDAQGQAFNVDVYVPPVISYAYEYVFLWRGTAEYRQTPDPQLQSLLYTLVEPDLDHPYYREIWLARQRGIAAVEKETYTGPIWIQRRTRFAK